MGTIIRQLPFGEARSYVEVHGRSVPILRFQPVVWVSIASKGSRPFDSRTPHIPAVVDLGFNGTFAIREEQLREWAGLDPRLFPRVRKTRLRGAPTDVRLAGTSAETEGDIHKALRAAYACESILERQGGQLDSDNVRWARGKVGELRARLEA